jgi:glycosyltransferase involved in cell wall biosynthesis
MLKASPDKTSFMNYSVVVPTFSRPDEVEELLTSLVNQEFQDFEVIIADGSFDFIVKQVVEKFKTGLRLEYLHEKGLGISEARNWGVKEATCDYVVFFDSLSFSQYFK